MKKFKILILIVIQTSICLAGGDLWQKMNGPYGGTVNRIKTDKSGNLIACADNGIYKSTDNGTSWILFGLEYTAVNDFCYDSSGKLWANCDDGAYRSSDNGNVWDLRSRNYFNSGLEIAVSKNGYILATGKLNNNLALFVSTNNGTTWSRKDNGFSEIISFLLLSDDVVFAGTTEQGIYKSTDFGTTWIQSGLNDTSITQIVKDVNNNLFAGTMEYGIYKSSDNGITWHVIGMSGFYIKSVLVDNSGIIWAGTDKYGLYQSTDNGNSWAKVETGLNNLSIFSVYKTANDELFVGYEKSGIFKSVDGGDTWVEANTGIDITIRKIVVNKQGGIFVATKELGVQYSSDGGASWVKINSGLDSNIIELTINSKGDVFAGSYDKGIYRTTNNGTSWTKVKNYQQFGFAVKTIFIDSKDNIYAGVAQDGIIFSSNNGNSWSNLDLSGIQDLNALVVNSSGNIFVGTGSNGVYRSLDTGKTWTNLDFPASTILCFMINARGTIFAGCPSGKIYRSQNNGNTWLEVSSLYYDVNDLVESGEGIVYAGLNNNGPYLSPDFGELWGPFTNGIGKRHVNSIFVDGNEIIYAGSGNGAYKTNYGYKPLIKVELISPGKGLTNYSVTQKCSWYKTRGADRYEIMVSHYHDFSLIIFQSDTLTQPFCTVTGLKNDFIYYWKVRAVRQDTISEWSDIWNFKTKISAPELTSPIDKYKNMYVNVEFKWSENLNATKYYIQISKNPDFSLANLVFSGETQSYNSHTMTLDNNTTYYWRMSCENSESQSEWSEVWSLTTIMSAPVLVYPEDGSTGLPIDVLLHWQKSGEALLYSVEVAQDSGFNNIVFYDKTVYDDTITVPLEKYNTIYFWRVMKKSGDKISNWSARSFTTGIKQPILINPVDNASDVETFVQFEWQKKPQYDRYHIEIATDDSMSVIKFKDSTLTRADTIIELDFDKQYFWHIRAKVDGVWSFWSDVWSFTTTEYIKELSAPVLLYPSRDTMETDTSITLTWDKSKGATNYQIQVSENEEFEGMIFLDSTLTKLKCKVSGLKYNYKYFWKVRASNSDTISQWSEVWNFRTKTNIGVENNQTSDKMNVVVIPNPFTNSTIIKYNLSEKANVSLKIYDLLGREVDEIFTGSQYPGEYNYEWIPEGLSQGIYYYILIVNGKSCQGIIVHL